MSALSSLRRGLAGISRATALTGLYTLLVSALLVSADIVIRKATNVAFVGIDELGGYAMAIATSWSLAYAFFQGSHIRVNVIHMNLRPSLKAWLDVLAVLVTTVMVALLAHTTWLLAFDSWEFNAVSNTPLRLPLWIPQFMVLAGFVLFAVSAVVVFIEALGLALRGQYLQVIQLVEEEEISQPEASS